MNVVEKRSGRFQQVAEIQLVGLVDGLDIDRKGKKGLEDDS